MSHKRTTSPRSIAWEIASLLMLLLSFQAAIAQSAALPATKPGLLLGQFLKLCQGKDNGSLAAWFTRNSTMQAPLGPAAWAGALSGENGADACRTNGGLRLESISKSQPDAVSAVVEGPKLGIWYDLTLTADGRGKLAGVQMMPTGLLAGVQMLPTAPFENTLPRDLSDTSVRQNVADILLRLNRAGLFSGIVMVARGDRILVSAAAGYANRDRKSPITGDSQFQLGSMGKMFTAVAVGQLVDQHKLSFGDTVGKFFPDYPNQTVRDKVTVGMLLSHTAGLGDFLSKRTPEMVKNGVRRAAEFMPLYDRDEPLFAPGTSWAYSNAGLALAGAIVEKVSGEDYPDYLVKHVFAAAGMRSSNPNNIPHRSDRLVTPYTRLTMNGSIADWHEAPHDIGSPAGGAISSGNDLVRFANALRTGKLLSKRTFEEMTENYAGNYAGAHGIKYGYGFNIQDTYDCSIVGHTGGFAGVSTRLSIFLKSAYTVVVLANQDPPAETYAGRAIVALIAEKAKRELRARRS